MRGIFGILLSVCVFSGANAAHEVYRKPPLVDVAALKQWTSAGINSVEGLLEKLPVEYRAYGTFVFSSRGLHRASPQNPLGLSPSLDRSRPRGLMVYADNSFA
jgi:hypothetical protein